MRIYDEFYANKRAEWIRYTREHSIFGGVCPSGLGRRCVCGGGGTGCNVAAFHRRTNTRESWLYHLQLPPSPKAARKIHNVCRIWSASDFVKKSLPRLRRKGVFPERTPVVNSFVSFNLFGYFLRCM